MRVLVHLGADAVAAVVVDDAVRVRLGGDGLLDGGADVGEPATGDRPGQAGPHRALGDGEQRGVLGGGLPHRDGDGGVAVPALQDRAAVDGDVVALGQRPPAVGDAVHDLVVDRRADAAGETVVAQE